MALLTHLWSPHAASSPPLECGLGDLVLINTIQQRGCLGFEVRSQRACSFCSGCCFSSSETVPAGGSQLPRDEAASWRVPGEWTWKWIFWGCRLSLTGPGSGIACLVQSWYNSNLRRSFELSLLQWIMPRFLIHRGWKIISACCFMWLGFGG